MSEAFCGKCGHRNQPDANFCSSCGAPLDRGGGEKPTLRIQLDAPAPDDEVSVNLEAVPMGTGLLMVKRGPNAGSRFLLDKEVVTVGRHPDSDVFLDDITVSRRHVEIARGPKGYRVRDVGSLNGTYLNRERIDDATLDHGDELQVGKFKLVFLSGRDGES